MTESQWFDLSPQLNLFHFPENNGHIYGENFLRILQTINPTYDIQTVKPFADFPKYIEQNGYPRHINPTKRTVALAVFAATPGLVRELASINPLLYETDRIEVGRRLDYSRWINFVELAASTRWSEIAGDLQILLDKVHQLAPNFTSPLTDIIANLKPATRIKNGLQDQLEHWLKNLPSQIQSEFDQLIETTTSAVMRADHFHTARHKVRARLPLFVLLGGSSSGAASLYNLMQIIADKTTPAGQQSNDGAQTFLDELNEQLATLQFQGKTLTIGRSSADVALTFAGEPVPISADGPQTLLNQLQAKACLAVALSRVVYRTEPILLLAGPERALPSAFHDELANFVTHMSSTCQCLYSFSEIDIFPEDIVGRRYSAADLSMS